MGMEPFVPMDDNAFGHLIASIPNPVDAFQRQLAFSANLDAKKAQTAQDQAQTDAIGTKLNRAQMFQQDLTGVQGNPSPQNVSALMMKYPEFADQIKQGWDVKDKAQSAADLTSIGQVYSPALSGNWDLAKKAAHERYDADKAAGKTTADDDTFLSQVDAAAAGDKSAQKMVLTHLGLQAAAAAGPEHFASVYGALNNGGFTLDAGAVRYDTNGNVVAQSPFIKGNDGAIYERDGSTATPSAAPPPAKSAPGGDGGFDTAVAFTLKHEGGYNPHDMNGAPVNFGINQGANPNVDVKSLTPDEAKGIYKTKYWDQSGAANLPANMQTPYFDTYIINPKRAEQFLKASGGDPAKFMQLRENWMGQIAAKNPQYAKAYATRNADLRLTMQGADQGSDAAPQADGAPAGYHTLIAGKSKDAPAGYQWTPQGTLAPIPGGPADKPGNSPPSDQELSDAATQYLLTGQMPNLGMGGGGLKQQILAKRSELMKNLGITAEQLPAFQAQYKSDQNALTKTSELASGLQSSENALKSNAQQVWNTHRVLVQDGIISNNPFITRQKLNYYERFGSPDQKAHVKTYLDAVNAYSTEYSKFMTSASGLGGAAAPSDSARTQAGELNDPGLAATPLLAHLRQGLTEAINKRNGVVQQQQALQQKLSSYLHPHSAEAAAHNAPQANIPARAIDLLKKNPTPQMRQFFDQKFGPGKAAQILGG